MKTRAMALALAAVAWAGCQSGQPPGGGSPDGGGGGADSGVLSLPPNSPFTNLTPAEVSPVVPVPAGAQVLEAPQLVPGTNFVVEASWCLASAATDAGAAEVQSTGLAGGYSTLTATPPTAPSNRWQLEGQKLPYLLLGSVNTGRGSCPTAIYEVAMRKLKDGGS
jgi:hypothetical protein